MAIIESTRFKKHSQAICSELEGKVAIFQCITCNYLVLNESGSAIWNALTTQPTLAELCLILQQEYSVSTSECFPDIVAWLELAVVNQIVIAIED